MAELDVEALKQLADEPNWFGTQYDDLKSYLLAIIAALEDRDRLRAWIDNHEYLAAYPSLTECIEDQRRAAALEDRDRLRAIGQKIITTLQDDHWVAVDELRAALKGRDG